MLHHIIRPRLGYDRERPTEGDEGQLAALFPKGNWIMAAVLTTSREDDLVRKCLECVPIWRMVEGVKNAMLNKRSAYLSRLYKIICGSVALMYSYTHGQINFGIIARLSDPGVGNISSLVDPMLPRVYAVGHRSLFLVSFELFYLFFPVSICVPFFGALYQEQQDNVFASFLSLPDHCCFRN